MLKKTTVIQIDTFKGMSKVLAPPKLPDGYFVDLHNVRIFLGDLTGRNGSLLHKDTGESVQALFDFRRVEGTSVQRFFMVEHGGVLYKLVAGVETAIQSGLVTTRPASMVSFGRNLIGSDGEALPFFWDGTGTASTFAGPRAKFLKVFNNHVFAAGIKDLANDLRVSNKNAGETWDIVDTYQLDSGLGDQITGMGNPSNYLSIYQYDSVWVLAGSSRNNFQIAQVAVGKSQGQGPVSHEGIVTVNRVDYYIGKYNVFAFDGSYPRPIGDDIARHLIQTMNPGRRAFVKGRYWPKYNEIIWAFSSGSSNTNDQMLVLNLYTGGFQRFSGINAEAMELIEDDNGQPFLYTGEDSGKILRQDSADTDNGADISYGIECKAHSLENPALYKRHRNLVFFSRGISGVTPTINWWFDQDESQTRTTTCNLGSQGSEWDVSLWDVATWDGAELVRTNVPVIGVGRQLHWRLLHTGKPFSIQSYNIEGRSRGLR